MNRMVSVMDVSKKYGLEYRLLHAIIKGHPWYGDWGYEFATGSFALTLDAYKLAVEKLSTLPLSTFLGRHSSSFIHDIILRYQSLSERELLNIRDLFGFLISLVHNASKCSSRVDDAMSKKRRASTSGVLYSWTKSDVDCVEEAMVKVLRAVSGSNWVNQRNLRKVVYKGQPSDLLDYCLNELGGKMVADGIFVSSRRNSDGDFEYRLVVIPVLKSCALFLFIFPFVLFSLTPNQTHIVKCNFGEGGVFGFSVLKLSAFLLDPHPCN